MAVQSLIFRKIGCFEMVAVSLPRVGTLWLRVRLKATLWLFREHKHLYYKNTTERSVWMLIGNTVTVTNPVPGLFI